MTYFMLGLALLGAVLLLIRGFVGANPKTLAQVARWSLITLGILLALFLVVRGNALLAAIPAGIAAFAWRALRLVPLGAWFGLWRAYQARAGAGPTAAGGRTATGDRSRVETDWLRMILDHDSGEIDGDIRDGPFAGRRLSSLDEAQLFTLLEDCHREDPRAVPLLESYLDRALGPDWREAFAARPGAGRGGQGGTADGAGGPMTRDEAFEILGLEPGASEADIKDAHRRLMLKLHPDIGGSDYLAAKINQAKDLLLGA